MRAVLISRTKQPLAYVVQMCVQEQQLDGLLNPHDSLECI